MFTCVNQKYGVIGWLLPVYKKLWLFIYIFTWIAKEPTAGSHFPFSLHVWSTVIHPLPEDQMCPLHVVCRAIVICHCWLISYCGRHVAIESHPELWAMSWWCSLSDEHKCLLISVGMWERCAQPLTIFQPHYLVAECKCATLYYLRLITDLF